MINRIMRYLDFGFYAKLLTVVFVSCSFVSCDHSAIFDKSVSLEDNVWQRSNVVEFEIEISDTIQPNDFYLQFRNTTDYEYSNLYVFLDTQFPNGDVIRDTIQCLLAEQDGKWLGKGFGKVKSNRVLLRKNVIFPMAGEYVFRFEQAMRVAGLNGISDFGVRIEKSGFVE